MGSSSFESGKGSPAPTAGSSEPSLAAPVAGSDEPVTGLVAGSDESVTGLVAGSDEPVSGLVAGSDEPVSGSVSATPAALEAIDRLQAAQGPLAIFQSGGCCDGTSPICLRAADMAPSPHDLMLGTLGSTPFYIDADQYERWNRPRFLIDVSPGAAMGFSLEGLHDVHFVTRTDDPPR